jgi:hypothetical protein
MAAAALCFVASGGLFGDDQKQPTPAKETPVPSRVSLPQYYSRLGLSPDQRKEILRKRGEYRAKIDDLLSQIKRLREQEKSDLEKVLTQAQRDRLREILLERGPKENKSTQTQRTTKGQ